MDSEAQREDRYLTPRDVAALLRLSLSGVYSLAHKGAIPSVRIGRAVRFRRADLDAALRAASRGREAQ